MRKFRPSEAEGKAARLNEESSIHILDFRKNIVADKAAALSSIFLYIHKALQQLTQTQL